MNGRANMAFEPAGVCESLREEVPDFANLVQDSLTFLDKREFAREFEVADWIVSRWADGTACPGIHVQLSIRSWITRRAMELAQVPKPMAIAGETP